MYENPHKHTPFTDKVQKGKHAFPTTGTGKGTIRELGEITKGQYAYGLTPSYIQAPPANIDDNSPYLPELIYNEPVIQFNMEVKDLTIRELAIIGNSTWALLKRDAKIIMQCRKEYQQEIARETKECLSGIAPTNKNIHKTIFTT